MTKKNVLLIGLAGTLLIGFLFLLDTDSCYVNVTCKYIRSILNQDNLTVIFIAPFLLLLSLITYKMKEGVFRAWWGFARWFAPVIIVVPLLQNTAHTPSGFGGVASGAFDFALLFILYALFVLISLIRIARAYTRTK